MKIAIIGTRGIPASYGGFETFAEELAARLVQRGHQVTVYGRPHYVPAGLREHRGARVIVLPTLRSKYLETVVHAFLSVLHAVFRNRYDLLLVCNSVNSLFTAVPRVLAIPTVVNVDGLERFRRKWNWMGRFYYQLSEYFSIWFPHAVVTDARVIRDYYQSRHHYPSRFIPYGAPVERSESGEILHRWGLEPHRYFLYVSRLEPENNAHVVMEAHRRAQVAQPLVLVGDAPYSRRYIRHLRERAHDGVVFTGSVYGRAYRELLSHALCYIHATEVGGTHPALLEAMGAGCVVIANETPENVEVLGPAGLTYRKNDPEDLAGRLRAVSTDPAAFRVFRERAQERVRKHYSWDRVVDLYERLFLELVRAPERSTP